MGNGHPAVGTELELVHCIVSYRGKHRVERAPASALLFHGKRKRGKGWRGAAEAIRDRKFKKLRKYMGRGWLDERGEVCVVGKGLPGRLLGRGVKVYRKKATQTKLRSSKQFVVE